MPSLNMLIYNKIIKQTSKPVVHVQNVSSLNMLRLEVTMFCHVYKTPHESLKLTDENVDRSKYTV